MLWYNSRHYDPQLGRFIQPDSIVPLASQGVQAYDRYGYVNNNPVRYTDPTGHCILCLSIAVAGGALLGAYIYSHYIHEPSRPADGNASTVFELTYLGYEHAEHANIVGEGLQSLMDQKSLQGHQTSLINQIRADPRYRAEAFAPEKISEGFTANGPSGHWYLAVTEPAFWMVHGGRISATQIKVSENGTISLTWKVTDKFDYIPRWEKGIFDPYNLFAVPMHFLYNTIGGAKKQYTTNAYWKQTIPPPPNSCGHCE